MKDEQPSVVPTPLAMIQCRGRTQPARVLLCIFILLPSSFILWSLAYQAPLRQTIHVGGDAALQRRFDDGPFLTDINGSEPGDRVSDPDHPGQHLWWWELLTRTGARPYRWTTAATTVHVPGAGQGLYAVEILAGGRPGGAPTTWETGPGLRYTLNLPEGTARRYRILAAADQAGDLRVTLRTPPYAAPGDSRELGFVLHELRVAPAHGPPTGPAWPQLGWLALTLAGVFVAALAAGTPLWGAGSLVALGAGSTAYVLAFNRATLTSFTPTLAMLAGLCAAVSLAGMWAACRLSRDPRRQVFYHEAHEAHEGQTAADCAPHSAITTAQPYRHSQKAVQERQPTWVTGIAPLVGLVAAAFALRMAGMLHPHALYSDSGLQANKLYEASLGNIFLTAGLPSDAGGGQAPYPPGPFLTMMPLELIFPAGRFARVLLVQAGTALLDSLTVALIWLMLGRAGLGRRAALLGAACYLLPVPALESFSVGELANLGGQALSMPFIALLALGAAAPGAKNDEKQATKSVLHPASFILHPSSLLTVSLLIGLVAHSGVTLSLGALVAAAWGIAMVWVALRRRGGPFSAMRLSVAASVALGLALLLYYTAPVYLGAMLGRNGTGGAGTPLGQILAETIRAVLGLAPPNRRSLVIPTLLGVTALAGLGLLWVNRGARPRAAALRATLAAWWAGTLLTQGLLLVADQGVRWAIFLYPALCLSAGVLLDALWRRGRVGRLVAGLILGAIISYGLATWIVQVRDSYHI